MLAHPADVLPERRVFCTRTLNLRAIQAVGYDMDYTLVHYNVFEWEGRAYEHIRQSLSALGWPVDDLVFDPEIATRGLVIDVELGNICKANRFGYVKAAKHGTKPRDFSKVRRAYARTLVDLGESRYRFLNTLFAISEACMYAQLVDLLDSNKLPKPLTYQELYAEVRRALDLAHIEGELKHEIMEDPGRFVELDPGITTTIFDQRAAGKKVILITNSEWEYTHFMMQYAIERYLPKGMRWRELFDLVVVSARKPGFFQDQSPIFEVIADDGTLKPVVGGIQEGRIYLGGNASMIERCFDIDGEQILYVGDHIFGDVNVSKSVLRWRTALVVRELEEELTAVALDEEATQKIILLMTEKDTLEHEFSALRLDLQRIKQGYGKRSQRKAEELQEQMASLRKDLRDIDSKVGPLVAQDGREFNKHWGYLMRAGNDKSHFAKQVERYADIYTSRVSNLEPYTPFMYYRSRRGSLPHDP